MVYMNFLLSMAPGETLASVAKAVFTALSVGDYEARESSNHIGGEYFCSSNGETKVMLSDDEGHSGSPVWVHFCLSDQPVETDLRRFQDQLCAALIPAGIRVTKVEGFGKSTEQRIDLAWPREADEG